MQLTLKQVVRLPGQQLRLQDYRSIFGAAIYFGGSSLGA